MEEKTEDIKQTLTTFLCPLWDPHTHRRTHAYTQTHTDKKRQQDCVYRGGKKRLVHTLSLPTPCIPMTGSYNSLLYIYLYTYIYLFIPLPGVYRTSRYMGPCECYRCIDSQWIRQEQKYYTSSCLDGNHQGNYSSDVRCVNSRFQCHDYQYVYFSRDVY